MDARLTAAVARRAPLAADTTTTAYRLIHRAADGFPDLAVDRYGDVLVAHVYSAGRRVAPPTPLLKALAEQVGNQVPPYESTTAANYNFLRSHFSRGSLNCARAFRWQVVSQSE